MGSGTDWSQEKCGRCNKYLDGSGNVCLCPPLPDELTKLRTERDALAAELRDLKADRDQLHSDYLDVVCQRNALYTQATVAGRERGRLQEELETTKVEKDRALRCLEEQTARAEVASHERDQARSELEWQGACTKALSEAQERYVPRIAQLETALKKYGRHLEGCPAKPRWYAWGERIPAGSCNCGFDKESQ